MIAAHYGFNDVFDNLIISLCKFTTLSSEVGPQLHSHTHCRTHRKCTCDAASSNHVGISWLQNTVPDGVTGSHNHRLMVEEKLTHIKTCVQDVASANI